MILLGIPWRHGQGEAVGLSVRPMRTRMAPAREGHRSSGLSQVQEPLLERPSSRQVGSRNKAPFPIIAERGHECPNLHEVSASSLRDSDPRGGRARLYGRQKQRAPTVRRSRFLRKDQAYCIMRFATPLGSPWSANAPGGTRTPDLILAREPLYPTELPAHRSMLAAYRSVVPDA
jgi:hypothetical protein